MELEPVFLVGAERSGTTLLRLMLDSHPELSFGEEFEYAVDQIQGNQFPDLSDYYAYLETHRIFQGSGFELNKELSYQELIESFLQSRQIAKASKYAGATVHFDFEKLPLLFPKAKYIHIVRDPRDVCASVMKMGWAFRPQDGSAPWVNAHLSWEKLSQNLSEDRWIRVHYEDLISDHQSVLKMVCSFIGIGYTQQMYSYADETDYEVPDPKIGSNWESSMKPAEIAEVEYAVGDLLDHYGYKASDYVWSPPSKAQEFTAKIGAKIASFRFRTNRYGILCVLGYKFSRTLGLSSLERRCLCHINSIDSSYLKKSWRTAVADGKSAR